MSKSPSKAASPARGPPSEPESEEGWLATALAGDGRGVVPGLPPSSGPASSSAAEGHTPAEVIGPSSALPLPFWASALTLPLAILWASSRYVMSVVAFRPPCPFCLTCPLAIGPRPCVVSVSSWTATPLAIGPRPCVVSAARGNSLGWLASCGSVFPGQVWST